jgi:quercetin dioxygenase-like cupin family protein
MSNETEPVDGVSRRTVLKAGAVSVGALGLGGTVAARYLESDDERGAEGEVDSPEGFGVEVLATHANFPNRVGARFQMEYEGYDGAVVSDLPLDASSVVVARVTWQPEGTSGWHTHPGPVIVTVVDGEIEVINERDCVVRTYATGEAFVDPGQGNVHIASNPSTTDDAVAYATFLGVPAGMPATIWVAPVDCQSQNAA